MDVHFSLLKAKSLCLAGVRSRYGNDANHNNTFTIRVTKAGILDRKYDLIQGGKKATARGWRPFGIILSGSQIIFFADLSSYQSWLDKEENPSGLGSKRNNSFPAFSSIVDSSSNLSVNNTTVNSLSSLYTQQQNTPIPHNSSSSTTSNSYLRPVQIVSLSYAICICDEEYTKYPHVFRLITGDGQQFLLRADNDKEMEDWMLKINYAATLKTTGVRMRPTRKDGDKLKREDKAKEKVSELSDRIDEQVKLLDRELQLRRNLMVLSPYQKSTKDRIISFAETLGKRIKTKRIELQRLICYRDYLESELSFSNCQQTRKLSLPTHLYPFPPTTTTTPPPRSSLVFTSTENEPISNQSTSTCSSHQHRMETSSAISQDDDDDDGEEVNADEEDEDDVVEEEEEEDKGVKSISSDSRSSFSANEEEEASQLPSFSFPKSFIESLSFMDTGNVKTASDKAVEMDRMMRRRSQSNPVLPRPTIVVDKKLLLEPPHRRQRSGSEASSVKEDDDDMSVIIVNESEELLTDPTWPITPTH